MKQYLDLLRHIKANGEEHDDRTGVGALSIYGYQLRFDLTAGFPLLTTKKIPLRWVFEELRWFLSGSTYEPDLSKAGVNIWKEWATAEQCGKFNRKEGDLGPVYGQQWRAFGCGNGSKGVDQIAELIDGINENPNSRRLIVTGWHPRDTQYVALPPCHTLCQFKVHRDRRLSCHLYARSIDSFLGLPFNIASYALLTEMIAHVTSLAGVRDLIISFGDVHIYENHLDAVTEQLNRAPVPGPRIRLNRKKHNGGLDALLAFKWSDITIDGYYPQASISAPVAV